MTRKQGVAVSVLVALVAVLCVVLMRMDSFVNMPSPGPAAPAARSVEPTTIAPEAKQEEPRRNSDSATPERDTQPRRLLVKLIVPGWPHLPNDIPIHIQFIDSRSRSIAQHSERTQSTIAIQVPSDAVAARISSIGDRRRLVRLASGRDTETSLEWSELVYCRGRVVAGDGKALPHAQLISPRLLGAVAEPVAVADAAGGFANWLPIGTLLSAVADNFSSARGIIVSPRHAGSEIVFVCAPCTHAIDVSVVDSLGKPICGASVLVGCRWAEHDSQSNGSEGYWRNEFVSVQTDDAGRATAAGEWSNHKTIECVCRKDGLATFQSEVVVSKIDTCPSKRLAVAVVMDSGEAVQGMVVDASGAALPGIRVWWELSTLAEDSATTGPDGRFVLLRRDLRQSHTMTVDSQGWKPVSIVVDREWLAAARKITLEPLE